MVIVIGIGISFVLSILVIASGRILIPTALFAFGGAMLLVGIIKAVTGWNPTGRDEKSPGA
ncbi:MAG: hypothetical protein ACREJB_12915 [Planctomycetaceae bacterium]